MAGVVGKLSDLEKSYSCSCWTGNEELSPNEVVNNFTKAQNGFYQRNVANVSSQLDVTYGAQKLDLWGVDEVPNASQLFVFLHGGYWQEGDKSLCTSLVEPLVRRGVLVAIVGYDLAPKNTIMGIVGQVVQALGYLRKQYPDAEVILGGHSVGAHLVAKALEASANCFQIKKMVLLGGLFTQIEGLLDTYIGKDMGLTLKDALEANVDSSNFAKHFPNGEVLLLCAEHDAPKIEEQNEWLEEKLVNCGIKTTRKIIPRTNHFSILEGLHSVEEVQTKYLLDFIM